MEVELKKTSISLPESIMDYLDRQAAKWMTHRSAAITRIVMEWRNAQAEQLPLATAEETPQDNPTEDMKRAGCGRLVEA